MVRTLGGYLLGATALVACPCHLPITLPLLLALLGGTQLGALLVANLPLVALASALYFLLALAGAAWLLWRRSDAPSRAGRPRRADACCAQPWAAPDERAAEPAEVVGRG